MFEALPKSGLEFQDWSWEKIKPYFDDLSEREITVETIEAWLTDWTKIRALVEEALWRIYVQTTLDTTDEEANQSYLAYREKVYSPMETADQELKVKFLDTGLEPKGLQIPLGNVRDQVEIFREENLPLLLEERKLGMEYNKVIGAQTVKWDGEEQTLQKLEVVLQEKNHARREQSWRLAHERWLEDRIDLNRIWSKLTYIRSEIAENADKPEYRAYRWKFLNRVDYSPDDCRQFHESIEQVVLPALIRVYARRRERLGLENLRPWDLVVTPYEGEALQPYTSVEQLEGRTRTIFDKIDLALGSYFEAMQKEELLDLENRKGKAPGAYCMTYAAVRKPFIFMNSVGTHDNVRTILHEAGHAFHVFEKSIQPYFLQMKVPMEFAEVASMSMEMLAYPYLEREEGGFYSARDAARAKLSHLESILAFWPYMAVVDAFQHWVYENLKLAGKPENCDEVWGSLWDRFMVGVDWSGLEAEKETGWHRKLHIFRVPFYYIEYGLARLGSIQVWENAIKDPDNALGSYREALSLGGTASLLKLFETAGATFGMDVSTVTRAVDFIESQMEELEAVI